MQLVIPTLGRCRKELQHTFRQLEDAGFGEEICVVVQPHEADWWKRFHLPEKVFVLSPKIKGIAATRDWIIYEMDHVPFVCMLDDDLHFAARREDDPTKFRQPEVEDIHDMLRSIEHSLRLHPHVSIGSREGGNRVTEPVSYNTRMMRVLAYDRSVLKKHHITFSPMEVMEDFHVTLQLLRAGYDCAVLNNWVSNQAGGSAAPGGCSTFRTLELQAENAHKLAARHPGFVKVVKKQTKTAWGGAERTDVVVQWKQAAAAGKRSRNA